MTTTSGMMKTMTFDWPTFLTAPKTGTGLWVNFELVDGSCFTALMENDILHFNTRGYEVQLASHAGVPVFRIFLFRKDIKKAHILGVVGRPDRRDQHGKVSMLRSKHYEGWR